MYCSNKQNWYTLDDWEKDDDIIYIILGKTIFCQEKEGLLEFIKLKLSIETNFGIIPPQIYVSKSVMKKILSTYSKIKIGTIPTEKIIILDDKNTNYTNDNHKIYTHIKFFNEMNKNEKEQLKRKLSNLEDEKSS